MKINYASKKLEKILSDQRLIKKKYGTLAEAIMMRMTEFYVAKNLSHISHLPPPSRHKLEGKENHFAVSISKNFRIVFCSTNDDAELDQIDEITIIEIIDYH